MDTVIFFTAALDAVLYSHLHIFSAMHPLNPPAEILILSSLLCWYFFVPLLGLIDFDTYIAVSLYFQSLCWWTWLVMTCTVFVVL